MNFDVILIELESRHPYISSDMVDFLIHQYEGESFIWSWASIVLANYKTRLWACFNYLGFYWFYFSFFIGPKAFKGYLG